MTNFSPENIFTIDPLIRWAGLATNKGKVVFSQMRPGVKSLTPEADDRLLLELRAQYITEMCGTVTQWSGPTDYIVMCHEKFVELITMLKNDYVAITLEKDVSPQAFPEIAKRIRSLEQT